MVKPTAGITRIYRNISAMVQGMVIFWNRRRFLTCSSNLKGTAGTTRDACRVLANSKPAVLSGYPSSSSFLL